MKHHESTLPCNINTVFIVALHPFLKISFSRVILFPNSMTNFNTSRFLFFLFSAPLQAFNLYPWLVDELQNALHSHTLQQSSWKRSADLYVDLTELPYIYIIGKYGKFSDVLRMTYFIITNLFFAEIKNVQLAVKNWFQSDLCVQILTLMH